MRILFFATLKERAGSREINLDLPEGTRVDDLKSLLAAGFPLLAEALPTALVSVNWNYAFGEDVIPLDAEVAIFPPVSGG